MTTIPKNYIKYGQVTISVYVDRKAVDDEEYKIAVAMQEALNDIEALFHAAQMRVVIKES